MPGNPLEIISSAAQFQKLEQEIAKHCKKWILNMTGHILGRARASVPTKTRTSDTKKNQL